MIKELIEKSESTDSFLMTMSFTASGGIALLTGLLINPDARFIYILLMFTILTFSFCFITKKIKAQIYKGKIEFCKFAFYKIENSYYSNNWNLFTYTETNEIVELNKNIDILERYFLVNANKYSEISKSQYEELKKVVNLKEKPLLKLNEEEYKEIINTDNLTKYQLIK